MAITVYVTGAQQTAAKAIVKRDAAKGKPTRPGIKKIAAAGRRTQQRSLAPASAASSEQ
jgi:hypothetical protein